MTTRIKPSAQPPINGMPPPPPAPPAMPRATYAETLKSLPRQTRPRGFNPYVKGGLGIIARRGLSVYGLTGSLEPGLADQTFLVSQSALQTMAYQSPLRLLTLLPDISPPVSLATWNALRVMWPVDGIDIVAARIPSLRQGQLQPDDAGSAKLDELWESQPSELGGLKGLLDQLSLLGLFTGLAPVEAVPAASMKGVARVWPVDSLTIAFGRDSAEADITPYQRQPTANMGWQRLSTDTFFWSALDCWVDDPYGRAPFAAALSEVLADIALTQDLRDAVHNGAWPRLDIGFPFEETHKVAVEVMRITDPQEAADWVWDQFLKTVEYVNTLKADDNLVHASTGKVGEIQGGAFQVEPILAYLRQRITQALKSLPTLQGINDGSTQTYTSIEWAIYAAGMEAMRAMILTPLLKAADLHLRLLGLPLRAVAKYEPIRTNDALVEANTEAVEIANAVSKRDQNWLDQEEACIEVTGHGPKGPAPPPMSSPPGQTGGTGVPGTPPGKPGQPAPGTYILRTAHGPLVLKS